MSFYVKVSFRVLLGGDWGLGWGLGFREGIGFRVFHMLDMCLSMSKYPLGSNLGGTGDWGGD